MADDEIIIAMQQVLFLRNAHHIKPANSLRPDKLCQQPAITVLFQMSDDLPAHPPPPPSAPSAPPPPPPRPALCLVRLSGRTKPGTTRRGTTCLLCSISPLWYWHHNTHNAHVLWCQLCRLRDSGQMSQMIWVLHEMDGTFVHHGCRFVCHWAEFSVWTLILRTAVDSRTLERLTRHLETRFLHSWGCKRPSCVVVFAPSWDLRGDDGTQCQICCFPGTVNVKMLFSPPKWKMIWLNYFNASTGYSADYLQIWPV